jgi:hypothetical protein
LQPLVARPPRNSNTRVIVLAAVGLFLMCGLGVGGIALVGLAELNRPAIELAADERELLVTVEDVAALYDEDELSVGDAEGTFKRGGWLGSKELEYEYDDSADDGLYLMSSLTVERSTKEARETYLGMQLGMKVMLSVGDSGVTREERNDLFRWGDDSKHYLLMFEGAPVGNVFVGRKGRHVYFLSLGGVALDEPESLQALLGPKLERAATWKP